MAPARRKVGHRGGYRLHQLKGADKGRWAIWVNANWRLTFVFREGNVDDVDYEDYH